MIQALSQIKQVQDIVVCSLIGCAGFVVTYCFYKIISKKRQAK